MLKRTLLYTLSFALCLSGYCLLVGCAAAPKNFGDAMDMIDKAAEVAAKQGMSYSADLELSNEVSLHYKQQIGAHQPISMKFHFQGNAAPREQADKPEEPVDAEE